VTGKTDEERAGTAKTPEQAEILERNALKASNTRLAELARRRWVELRARDTKHGTPTDVERECIEAVHALEKTKGTRATYTWRMFKDRGIIPAVDHLVQQRKESAGYNALVAAGLKRHAFEAVVLRNPGVFSAEAVTSSRERLGPDWKEP